MSRSKQEAVAWHSSAFSGSHAHVATFHNVIMLKTPLKGIPELKVHRRLFELGMWGDVSPWKRNILHGRVSSPGSYICLQDLSLGNYWFLLPWKWVVQWEYLCFSLKTPTFLHNDPNFWTPNSGFWAEPWSYGNSLSRSACTPLLSNNCHRAVLSNSFLCLLPGCPCPNG